MLAEDLYNELNDITKHLISKGIVDDQNFPSMRKDVSGNDVISVSATNGFSFMCKEDYIKTYERLSDDRVYNVRFVDGGLALLMYTVKNNNIIKHRLTYYPSPLLDNYASQPEAYMMDQLYLDIISRKIIPFPIRFDFDPDNHIDMEHPVSHLTLGDVDVCRIPITSAITPIWFFKFLLSNFYRTKGTDCLSDIPKHKCFENRTLTASEAKMVHMTIPS